MESRWGDTKRPFNGHLAGNIWVLIQNSYTPKKGKESNLYIPRGKSRGTGYNIEKEQRYKDKECYIIIFWAKKPITVYQK
jgi:hypothetical protein